jgi:hypothetical protein
MVRCSALARALITIVLLASWNITTTHCAFAAATTRATASVSPATHDECPMHSSKAPAKPAPQKKKGCADLPCCKNLPAAKPLAGISVCKPPVVLAAVHHIAGVEQLASSHARQPALLLDTGPPAPDNFVEVVLQRSIPAHAPPAV